MSQKDIVNILVKKTIRSEVEIDSGDSGDSVQYLGRSGDFDINPPAGPSSSKNNSSIISDNSNVSVTDPATLKLSSQLESLGTSVSFSENPTWKKNFGPGLLSAIPGEFPHTVLVVSRSMAESIGASCTDGGGTGRTTHSLSKLPTKIPSSVKSVPSENMVSSVNINKPSGVMPKLLSLCKSWSSPNKMFSNKAPTVFTNFTSSTKSFCSANLMSSKKACAEMTNLTSSSKSLSSVHVQKPSTQKTNLMSSSKSLSSVHVQKPSTEKTNLISSTEVMPSTSTGGISSLKVYSRKVMPSLSAEVMPSTSTGGISSLKVYSRKVMPSAEVMPSTSTGGISSVKKVSSFEVMPSAQVISSTSTGGISSVKKVYSIKVIPSAEVISSTSTDGISSVKNVSSFEVISSAEVMPSPSTDGISSVKNVSSCEVISSAEVIPSTSTIGISLVNDMSSWEVISSAEKISTWKILSPTQIISAERKIADATIEKQDQQQSSMPCGFFPCDKDGSLEIPCWSCTYVNYCSEFHRATHRSEHKKTCKRNTGLTDYRNPFETEFPEYAVWRSHSLPFFYSRFEERVLDWPSYTVDWIPQFEGIEECVLLGTMTNQQEQDFVMIASISPPPFAVNKSGINIMKKIKHPTEVNRARCMPKDPTIIATKGQCEGVFVFFTDKYPTAENEGFSPDLHLAGHTDEGYALDWNPGRKEILLSGSYDKLVCHWDINSDCVETNKSGGVLPVRIYRGHDNIVEDIDWRTNDDSAFVSVGDDKNLIVWDMNCDKFVYSVQAHKGEINCVEFNPFHEMLLATASCDKTIALWDMRNLSIPLYSFDFIQDTFYQLAWCPNDPDLLAFSGDDTRVYIFDVSKLTQEPKGKYNSEEPQGLAFIHAGHTARVLDLCWHPKEKHTLCSVAADNILQVWQINPQALDSDTDQQAVKLCLDDNDCESVSSLPSNVSDYEEDEKVFLGVRK